ncbi:NADP-dependent oxidoreductase domain-containing protein [Nemania sp. FL0031]|nr:NADP-dependent oxidoreductase domain-containing protein [Nemania sp. FL0031]
MIKFCKETGVGIIPWSPLYRGLLARPLDEPDTVRGKMVRSHPVFKHTIGSDEAIIKRVSETVAAKCWKMSQVALMWLVQKGAIPITGISSVDRVDDAVGIRGKVLTDEELKYLEEPYQAKAISGHS